MQGRKDYTEKLFTNFQLSNHVPKENFYRKLRETLNLSFLYKDTKELYGSTGNPSIDPVVFFKLMLTGYLENLTSDRKLVEHCSMRMDILYFLGYGAHKVMLMSAIAFTLKSTSNTKEVMLLTPFLQPFSKLSLY